MNRFAFWYFCFMLMEKIHAPIEEINDPMINKFGVKLFVKREDLIHPHISGNKWRKLKYNIIEAKRLSQNTLLTFGGAFSNNIIATASAGKEFEFKTIGIIRGEEHFPLNPILQFAKDCGMELHYIDRTAYRQKEDEQFIKNLKLKFADFYLLPEGGSNDFAVKGCTEILNDVEINFNHVCCCCGTGATLAGIILSLKENQNAIGFSVLKGTTFLNKNVRSFINSSSHHWEINHDYHFGGYAKTTKELLKFIEGFELRNKIPIEPIYTGKMFFGIYDLIKKDFFKKGETILAIHTGGLQKRK